MIDRFGSVQNRDTSIDLLDFSRVEYQLCKQPYDRLIHHSHGVQLNAQPIQSYSKSNCVCVCETAPVVIVSHIYAHMPIHSLPSPCSTIILSSLLLSLWLPIS